MTRKNFMINRNGSDPHRPGFEPRSLYLKSNALPIELTSGTGKYTKFKNLIKDIADDNLRLPIATKELTISDGSSSL